MHIILVSNRLATAKSISLGVRHFIMGGALLVAAVVALSSSMSYLIFRHTVEIKMPVAQHVLLSAQEQQARNAKQFMRQNLNAIAVRVGQMQAQLVRLDALGERLSALAGIKPQEFRMSELPALGGALPTGIPAQDLSMNELSGRLDALSKHLDNRNDYLGLLEDRLFDAKAKRMLMPAVSPVAIGWNEKNFGWRIDPFTGQKAMHEGTDFMADMRTPVHAAASGVVVVAQRHPQYGNMIDIDHGNGFTTRYAHLSKLMVEPGDVVRRGAIIGLSGSTGRSTGPHLHFEVRYKGVAQNPTRFLRVSAASLAKN
ncbi:MAG TPA: M23 family metallopeptidase [Burkholderiales bacterium]|nr:M23 family metallopeptidase [Burkholderiales bacterium]